MRVTDYGLRALVFFLFIFWNRNMIKCHKIFIILHFIIFSPFENVYHISVYHILKFWLYFIIFTLSYYEYDKVYFCTSKIGICILLSIHELIMKNQSVFWAQIFDHLSQHPPQTFILLLTTSRKQNGGPFLWITKSYSENFINLYHIEVYHISDFSEFLSYCILSYLPKRRNLYHMHFIILEYE